MKTLLWKDYRQNRQLLAAAGAFIVAPYAIALVIAITHSVPGYSCPRNIVEAIGYGGALWALCLSIVASAFVAGNALAGERVDRSTEFLAYLPIRRSAAVASKAILAVGACMLAWGTNAAVILVARLLEGLLWPEACDYYFATRESWVAAVLGPAVIMLFVFGVSWLFSSILNSPAIAAASGLGTALLVVVAAVSLREHLWGIHRTPTCWLFGYMLGETLVGVGCFLAGSIIAVRRVEP